MTGTHQPQASQERTPWGALLCLMMLAAVLRGIALDQQLWYDEITTLVQSVRRPLGEILTTYTSQNQHVLYSVLARISMNIWGDHIWTLRLPAVVFGVLAVPALYFCARLWTTAREALLAAALLAVSYHHVWFSQNARGYTGLVFWTLVTTYLFVRASREQRTDLWLCFGITSGLGLYTHLTMMFVTAGQFLTFGWTALDEKLPAALRMREGPGSRRLRPLLGFGSATIVTLLLYAPILPKIFQKTVGPAAGATVQSEWTNPLWLVVEMLRGLAAGAGEKFGLVALPIAGVLALAGLCSYWRAHRAAVALMLLPGILTAAVMLVLEHNLWPRFFFFAIGFALVLLIRGVMVVAGWAAAALRKQAQGVRWGTALALLMIAASAYSVRSAWIYPKQDFSGAMQFVDAQRRADEPVLVAGLAIFPYTQYFLRDWRPAESKAALDAARGAGRPVWVLTTFPVFLKSRHPDVWETLERDFHTVRIFRGTMGDGEVRVYRWQPRAAP
jgi:uncharacterized membrane protein